MKVNINFRKILTITGWTALTGGVLLLLGFVSHKQDVLRCTGIVINISEDRDHEFVEEQDILGLIYGEAKIIGKPIGTINTALLEKIILTNPFIERAEVYSAIGGKLHIDLVQRNPVVRIVNRNDEQFYIDHTGTFMPVSDRYTPPALVASGYIFNTFSELKVGYQFPASDSLSALIPRTIEQVYALARFIEADTFWSANTEQIYVNECQELEIVPRFGDHTVLIGDTTMLVNKFQRLMAFYREGMNNMGWNNYKMINLKFKGQVVCTKKN